MAWPPVIHQDVTDAVTAIRDTYGTTVHRLLHNGTAYPSRPSSTAVAAGFCEYVGPTEPTTWLDGDTWIERA